MRVIGRWSLSHLRHHAGRTLLAAAAVAAGTATFTAVGRAGSALDRTLAVTVDALAGHAHLHVTGPSGVPELVETLRALPDVDEAQPVIEQVVQPERTSLGALLIVGVDLLADTSRRDLRLEIDGATVDDPLVFIAQPDSLAISPDLAARAGLGLGDALEVMAGDSRRHFVVRALLASDGLAHAFGGNIAVMDVYAAQQLFGRGRRFDRIDVRLKETADRVAAQHAIEDVAADLHVDLADRRRDEIRRQAASILGAFDALTALALVVAATITWHVCSLAVDRRREDVGVFRAMGADPRPLFVAMLAEAALLGGAAGIVGATGGVLLSDVVLRVMGFAAEGTRGLLAGAVTMRDMGSPLIAGTTVGSLCAVVGAWHPAWRTVRDTPTMVLRRGVHVVRSRRESTNTGVLVCIVLTATAAVLWQIDWMRPVLLPIATGLGAAAAMGLAGAIVSSLSKSVATIFACGAMGAIRIAGSGLRQNARTATTGAALVIGAGFALGAAGLSASMTSSFDGWLASSMAGDLVIRASPGWGPSATRLPGEMIRTVRDTDAVAAADAVRSERIEYQGTSAFLVAIDGTPYGQRTHHQFLAGDAGAFDRLAESPVAVVTDDFASRFNVVLGDTFELPSPRDAQTFRAIAVVAGDRRAVMLDRSRFASHWGRDDVDAIFVSIAPDAGAENVRDLLRRRLHATPALILTRGEFLAAAAAAIEPIRHVAAAIVAIVCIVALLGVVLSQAALAGERTHEMAIWRALGATPRELRGALCAEAAALAAVCLVVAVPTGALFAWFLRTRVASGVAGMTLPPAYPVDVLAALVVILPVATLGAIWLMSWRLAGGSAERWLSDA